MLTEKLRDALTLTKAKLGSLTSDFKSSDFALAESALFICACSSSSLLMEGFLPSDSERTAEGAVVTGRRRRLFIYLFFSSPVAFNSFFFNFVVREGAGVGSHSAQGSQT